jgi:hypothetical protein
MIANTIHTYFNNNNVPCPIILDLVRRVNIAFLAPTAVELVSKRLRFNPVEEDQDFDSSDDDIYVLIVN